MVAMFLAGGSILALLFLVFWIWMLIDCIQNTRLNSNERLIWIFVIIFLNALGALIYLLVGRNKQI